MERFRVDVTTYLPDNPAITSLHCSAHLVFTHYRDGTNIRYLLYISSIFAALLTKKTKKRMVLIRTEKISNLEVPQ